MNDQLLSLLSLYIDGKITAEVIDTWIALNIWDATGHDRDLIDQVAVELAYLKDGLSDESDFRTRMAEILYPSVTLDTRPEVPVSQTIGTASSNVTVTSRNPAEVIDLQFVAQFA